MSKSKSTKEGKLDHPLLAEHADAIRSIGKRVISDVIEIGRRLTDARELAGHGNWIPWLDREFRWTEQTALNFIRVHELAESKNFLDLSLPISGLYLLAAPSTPDEARDEIIERAAGGEKVTTVEVKATIAKAKSSKPPKRPSRKTAQQTAPPIAEPEPPDKTISETPATPERHKPEAATPPFTQIDEPPAPALGPSVGPAATETDAAPLSDRNATPTTGALANVTEVAEAPSIVGETVTVESIDEEARELGELLRAWDRARPRVRKKFMERTGLYAGIPPFLDRREPAPADRTEAGVATAAGRDEALKHK